MLSAAAWHGTAAGVLARLACCDPDIPAALLLTQPLSCPLPPPRSQGGASRANSAALKPTSQQTGAEELTLAGKGSSAHISADEEAGPQATSSLKAPAANGHKRPMDALPVQPGFSFQAAAAPGTDGGMGAGAGGEEAAKKRRVQYDRMRALEAEVQRLRLVGDMLGQSLRSAQASVRAAGVGGIGCCA